MTPDNLREDIDWRDLDAAAEIRRQVAIDEQRCERCGQYAECCECRR